MTDTERCAHDLAVAYITAHPPILDPADKKYDEMNLLDFAAHYEELFQYFKSKICDK